MTDDHYSRYRTSDHYDRAAAPGGQEGDPLAELARLIGQNDPFSEFGRDSRPPAPQEAPQYAQPQAAHPAAEPYQPAEPYPGQPAYPAAEPAPEWYAASRQPQQPAAQPYAAGPHEAPLGYDAPRPGQPPHDGQHYQDRRAQLSPDRQYPGYPDPLNLNQPSMAGGPGYDPRYQPHGDGVQMPPPHADEFYDDAPRGNRRKGLIIVMAVLALAVVGTAGAFGYRSMFGGVKSNSLPPVIRASGEPSKVAPPAATPDAAAKFSYDRFGDQSKNERVVLREEQPVDPRELARSSGTRAALPNAMGEPQASPRGNAGPLAAATPLASAAPPPPAMAQNPPSALGEPRRVRTVLIKPDQPDAAARPQASTLAPPPAVAAPPSRPTNLTTATTTSNRLRGAAPPPARVEPPPPVRAVSPRAAPQQHIAAVPAGNGPLSLSPDDNKLAAQSSPVARIGAPRIPQAPTRIASAPRGEHGGYLVQVSSQRSEADARTAFRSIQARYASVLGQREPVIRRADLGGKGVYYRAMIGPFGSRDQAAQVCSSLKSAGGDCVVQSN